MNPKLVILRGSTGNYQSATQGVQLAAGGYKRLSSMLLRDMFHASVHGEQNEAFVQESLSVLVALAVEHGHDIVVDTSSDPYKIVKELLRIARAKGYETEVIYGDVKLSADDQVDAFLEENSDLMDDLAKQEDESAA